MESRNVIMIVVLVLLFVVAGALVVVGVVTHEEPGFASEDNRWVTMPLLVSCEVYAAPDREHTDEVCNVVWDVVGVINHRLGFQALSENGDVGGHIHVRMRSPVEVTSAPDWWSFGPSGPDTRDAAGGHYELTGQGTTYDHCDVWTMNVVGPNDLEWLTVYHELGHCLGLAHDDYAQSIMNPVQRPTPDGTIPPWISDYDRGLLRERYMP